MAQINASQIIQILLVADTLVAKIIDWVKSAKELDGADEAKLREVVAEIRAKNDAKFAEVDAILAAKSNAT